MSVEEGFFSEAECKKVFLRSLAATVNAITVAEEKGDVMTATALLPC